MTGGNRHKANRPTILVVDDAPENLLVLSELLAKNHTVRAVTSGLRALEAVKVPPRPDLILMDVMMPGMDGYECLRRLRDDPDLQDIPVIFVTALDSPEDERRGLELGAVDYITKPIKPAIVEARVHNHLELKQARDWIVEQNRFQAGELQRLLEILAHHLQEPVRHQIIYSQMLERSIAAASPQSAAYPLKKIMDGAIYLRAMLRDIMLYLSIPYAAPPRRPCDTGAKASRVCQAMAAAVADAGGEICLGRLPHAWVRDDHFGDVIRVLVQNAIDNHSPERPLRIAIGGKMAEDGMALFSVTDNGNGIPAGFRDRVFQIFERLQPADEGRRTGMGLALIKKIVDTAGGKVWIEDGIDGGVSVVFTFPGEPVPEA